MTTGENSTAAIFVPPVSPVELSSGGGAIAQAFVQETGRVLIRSSRVVSDPSAPSGHARRAIGEPGVDRRPSAVDGGVQRGRQLLGQAAATERERAEADG